MRASPALPRPGLALGPYPQREERASEWLENALTSTASLVKAGAGRRWGFTRDRELAHVVERIDGHARDLSGFSNADLRARSDSLRAGLNRDGLSEDLTARTFALVREVAERTVGLRHYDVQLFGGWAMAHGKLAEMQTGEGKTLTATLPAAAAALAGIPVHIVSVNDYLVARDAELMGPIYQALGLTVGTITEGLDSGASRQAYGCDITYCNGKQLVFDYLKDRLVWRDRASGHRLELERLYDRRARIDQLLLRGLCFAIVDEADSVLIDEARTPLILSKLGEAPSHENAYQQALDLARQLDEASDFTAQTRQRTVTLTEAGRAKLTRLAQRIGGLWSGPRRREELVCRALCALHIYTRDRDYLVVDEKVQIVDEHTGRIVAGRTWSQGLHQMIEAKEGCKLTSEPETIARITYQRFFRRYLKLAGMTGTAREVAHELRSVYKLDIVTVPTHRPPHRTRGVDRIYATAEQKWQSTVDTVRELHAAGRPVLVGTRNVADSERLSELLSAAQLEHRVLNARKHREEAEIIAGAGAPGRITVATNMAGRGTDIRLGDGVAERGGLHVIATQRNDASRIDRQLFGRSARQGDPGSCEAILSLGDDLVVRHYSTRVTAFATRWGCRISPIRRWLWTALIRRAQRATEREHARMRRELLKMDEYLGDMLAFTGGLE